MNSHLMSKPIIALLLFFSIGNIYAQKWDVPDDKKQKVSPGKFTNEAKKKGEQVFLQKCISCHGNPGKDNYVKTIVPPPDDPASDKFQQQEDGALFYKITTGRAPMPSFKDVLSDEERWQVISYIRSFNPKYIQPEPVLAPTGIYTGVNVSLQLYYLPKDKKIKVVATGTKDRKTDPLSNIDLGLYATRYFGNLPIDEPKLTNANGEAFFDYTDSIPGDSVGNLHFIVKVNTEGLTGFKKDTIIMAGRKNIAKSLINTRAMWTIGKMAPIWLILSYSLVVIAVWTIIIYIVFQIIKIRKMGASANNSSI